MKNMDTQAFSVSPSRRGRSRGENSLKNRAGKTMTWWGKSLLMALVLFELILLYPHSGLTQNKMYWVDYGTDKIQRANLDGTSVEDLVTTGLIGPEKIALDLAAGKMYWTDTVTGKIQRANLDGTSVEDLVTGLSFPTGIALDVAAGKMYWTDIGFVVGATKIQRANLDGTSVEDIVTGLGAPVGIALDVAAGKMYWTDAVTDKIQRANLDGSSVEDLVTTGLIGPEGIALDLAAGKMYWTDSDAAKIQRANLDGTGIEDLVTGLNVPRGIALAVADGKMYWTDSGTAKIQRANLDGAGVEDLVSGLIAPVGIALDVSSVAGEEPLFLAERSVTLSQATTKGNIHSNKDLTFKPGKNNTYTGDMTAVGKLTIQKKNTIDGDVTAGKVINTGTVTGTVSSAVVPPETFPVLNFTASGSNVYVPKNGTVPLAPGSYNHVSVLKAGTLQLSSGEYFMNMLKLADQTILEVDVSGGEVVVNVVGLLSFGKKSQVQITPGGEDATDQVTFNGYDCGVVKILSNAKVLGSIVSPGATVSLESNSRFKGSIIANVIDVNKGVLALVHGSSMSLPKVSPDFEEAEDAEEKLELTALPTEFSLEQNYPNPFNPTTVISFQLPVDNDVTLAIYNINGQLVKQVASGKFASGRHQIVWDATDGNGVRIASGVYFYRLVVQKQNGEAAFTETRRMMLMK